MYTSLSTSPKRSRGGSPISMEKQILLQAPINCTFSSLSLENLETWDIKMDIPGVFPASKNHSLMVHPTTSTPTDENKLIPFLPIPLSPVLSTEPDEYYKPIRRVGSSSATNRSILGPGRYPGENFGPRPIRGPPPFGPTKWKLFKRKTCPDLLKTRSTDNLFRLVLLLSNV